MSGDIHRKHNRIEEINLPKTFETDIRPPKSLDGDTKIETDKCDEENKSVSQRHLNNL